MLQLLGFMCAMYAAIMDYLIIAYYKSRYETAKENNIIDPFKAEWEKIKKDIISLSGASQKNDVLLNKLKKDEEKLKEKIRLLLEDALKIDKTFQDYKEEETVQLYHVIGIACLITLFMVVKIPMVSFAIYHLFYIVCRAGEALRVHINKIIAKRQEKKSHVPDNAVWHAIKEVLHKEMQYVMAIGVLSVCYNPVLPVTWHIAVYCVSRLLQRGVIFYKGNIEPNSAEEEISQEKSRRETWIVPMMWLLTPSVFCTQVYVVARVMLGAVVGYLGYLDMFSLPEIFKDDADRSPIVSQGLKAWSQAVQSAYEVYDSVFDYAFEQRQTNSI